MNILGSNILIEVQVPENVTEIQSNMRLHRNPLMFVGNVDHDGRVIPGRRRTSGKAPVFIKKRLSEYPIPQRLQNFMLYGESSELLDEFPYLGEELCFENYKEKFSNLLHLEEIEQGEQMARYTLAEVTFIQSGQYLSLEVPGLAEKRPSLAIGDTAIAKLSNDPRAQSYEGCIHEVKSKSVLLMFSTNFHEGYFGELYDVEFKFSRGQFKKMHQAIDEVVKHFGKQVLFPKEVKTHPPQVDFGEENEYPTLQYKVYPTKYREYKHKVKPKSKENDSETTLETSYNEDDDMVIEKIEIIPSTNDSSENLDQSWQSDKGHKVKRRRSVLETLFPEKVKNNAEENIYGLEWVTLKIPISKELIPDASQLKLEHQFVMPSQNHNRTKEYKKTRAARNLPPYVCQKPKVDSSGKLVLKWINQNLNPEQKNAVTRILKGEARPMPYIIYGPPGTGKTVTVVETVLQIFRLRNDSRILVVTPSNSAADLIVERIHNTKQVRIGDLARLNAFQRAPEAIPDVVKLYSFPNDELEVLKKVVRHRIVVATCTTSGGIYKLGLNEGHFTHCFIDEAGETTEPEAMIPIGLLGSSENSQIILAGDPKQLGPVLQCPIAKMYGLEMSFLERLSHLQLYQRNSSRFQDHGHYDPMLVTKLVRNYRSHQDILKIPSKLFYFDELLPYANQDIGEQFLINPNQHIVFHGVRGKNYQENDSPSWFNPTEAFQVVKYYQQLLNKGVDPDDVGIIAPYRQQTNKLRQILKTFELPAPRVRFSLTNLLNTQLTIFSVKPTKEVTKELISRKFFV